MPSWPQAILQAVANYKRYNEAVSTRKKHPSASLENTQNVKKACLLISRSIVCNRPGSLLDVTGTDFHKLLCSKHCTPSSAA